MDKIIYCNDLEALKTKLKADGYYDEESDSYTTNQTLTPIVKKTVNNITLSLSYVRGFCLDLAEYTMLEDLGSYDDILADTAKLDKYKSVYDYETPIQYTDENGDTQTYTRPFKIGVFA